MSKTAGEKNRLRLTEAGAAALQAWLDANGRKQVELGEHLGLPNQTAIHRAMNLKGLLTPQQVGMAVAFTGGAVTAVALVGKAAARKVPTLPPVEWNQVPAPSVPTPSVALDDGSMVEVDIEQIAKSHTPANVTVLAHLRDHAKSQFLKARCAELLLEYGEGKPVPRQVAEKFEPPVKDAALVAKFEALIIDARERIARDLPAVAAAEEAGKGAPNAG